MILSLAQPKKHAIPFCAAAAVLAKTCIFKDSDRHDKELWKECSAAIAI